MVLKRLVQMKLKQLDEVLEKHVNFIELQEDIDENGEIYYLIQISDLTVSLTTITCNKKGWDIRWGSSTPRHIKTLIDNVM
jgi:hypothetical protein